VLLLLVALLSMAGFALARQADAAADPKAPVRYHVVLPGETLWGIAAALDPSADPRDTIVQIVEANHLPSSAIWAGQRLVLPPGLPVGQ
jgi:LysM repeat protein